MVKINNSEKNTTENQIISTKQNSSDLKVFSSAISHEIKSPIRAIDGYARILAEDYGGQIDKNGLELIGNIRDICKDTLTLINKLLEYIMFSEAELIKEPIDLEGMIRSVFCECAESYSSVNHVELRFEGSIPSILTDRLLIRQVVINIISNSFKFTKNKKQGIITAGYKTENDKPVFYIRDNGAGFDMKFSENLFGMFQRMHSSDDFEGSGLGLAIVKQIMQKLGGTTWITGEVGKGACTYFSIPKEDILT